MAEPSLTFLNRTSALLSNNLRVLSYTGKVPFPAVSGGGLAAIPGTGSASSGESQVLLATGDGHLYLIDTTAGARSVHPTRQRVPLNWEEFAAAFGRPSRTVQIVPR